MKKVIVILISMVIVSCGEKKENKENHDHQTSPAETSSSSKSLSPHTNTMARVNGAHIHIDYSSPSVRDRIIFGGLVGYNTVWQAGAHKATWIQTDKDLVIDGQTLKAGKYGFFVIPGKEQWQVMFNSLWDQHGKDEYDEAENVLTAEVTPEELDEIQETLKYEVLQLNGKSGKIILAWEKVKIEVPFEVVD